MPKTREEFRKALGKPSIHFGIEIPEGYGDMTGEFIQLEENEPFKNKVKELVGRQLTHERMKEKRRLKDKTSYER
ncbi:MAG: hypothetical protein FGF48_04500 [Candidatus Brockarchaeota archaeon]|nr:hypothetical protein [Candidatus Brockarchaeota archaeon]